MTTTKELVALMAAARISHEGEHAFLRALLTATVHAHVPLKKPPHGRIQFIQFPRPDNGVLTLPFFSDIKKANFAGGRHVSIMSLPGRRLFELTLGANLMMDPNDHQYALYPAEVRALLAGEAIGQFATERIEKPAQAAACAPTVPTSELTSTLAGYYREQTAVHAAYIVEIRREDILDQPELLVGLVIADSDAERIMREGILRLRNVATSSLPLTMTTITPHSPIPEVFDLGIRFYTRA